MLQVIIANRLVDGVVVFLAPGESWVPEIGAGLVVEEDAQAQRLLGVAKTHEERSIVIDPQLIEVTTDGGRVRPVAIREAIRAFGPTVRTDQLAG